MQRFLAACSLLFLLPFSVRASAPAYLSEIAWAGSSASLADEWIEICGAPGVDLSGWTLEGASSAALALPDGALIGPSGAYLVANYGDADPKSTLNVAPDLTTTAIALSNTTLLVTLRDASGAAVDVAGASGAAPFAGASGEARSTMERLDASLDGGSAAAWASASTSAGFDSGTSGFGTPGTCPVSAATSEAGPDAPPASAASTDAVASASETPPTSAAAAASEGPLTPAEPPKAASAPEEPLSAIRISELYPSPRSGEREWAELVNRGNVGEFLDDWTIEDAAGTKTRLSGLLLPWARRVIEAPHGSLNNDGDTVILRDARGRALDRVAYPKIAKGEAYMRLELQDAFASTRTPTPGAANVLTEAAEEPAPEEPAALSAPREDTHAVPEATPKPPIATDAPRPSAAPRPTPTTPTKKAAKAKAPAAKYKGASYVATVIAPPGVYAKARAYVQREGAIEELRLSKAPTDAWAVGDRIAFVAQRKSEGAVAFLLANPNSVRVLGSASATFATSDAWPAAPGGYAILADISAIRGDALEVAVGGVEGDVLLPSGSASALKPGDTVRVEGFVAPGPRPRMILPYAHALRLMKARASDPEPAAPMRMPGALAIGLTAAAGVVGLAAYLRMQRLKRLALLSAPVDDGAWE